MILQSPTISGSLTVSGSISLNGEAVEPLVTPLINSISPTSVKAADASYSFTVTGTNFDDGATGTLIGSDNTEHAPTTSTRNSTTQITLFYSSSARLTGSLEPYSVKVVNQNGFNFTKANQVTVDDRPVWNTGSGRLGTIYASSSLTASFQLSATDPEGTPVSYSLDTGTLPSGLTLNTSSGEITGSTQILEEIGSYNVSGVQSNLTFSALDNNGNSTSRNFNILKLWLDGLSEAGALEYGSEAVAFHNAAGTFTPGRYWLTGIKSAGLAAQQVYVDSNGWMLFYRHAGTGGSFNSTYEIKGNTLGEAAVGTPMSPTMGLTDPGASTTANSRGVGRFSTEFTRALGGNSASSNVIWMICGGNTVYITDAQWWSTSTSSDGYGQTTLSYGSTHASRRSYTNFTGNSTRPMSTYPGSITTIPWYDGDNYSGGYDGTWHVATTIYTRQY
jgi:large repetitive protein